MTTPTRAYLRNVGQKTSYAGVASLSNAQSIGGRAYLASNGPSVANQNFILTKSGSDYNLKLTNYTAVPSAVDYMNSNIMLTDASAQANFTWTLTSVANMSPNAFTITATYNNQTYYWTLTSGQDGANITLNTAYSGTTAQQQYWVLEIGQM